MKNQINEQEVNETVAWVTISFTCPFCNEQVSTRERMQRLKGSTLKSFEIDAYHACVLRQSEEQVAS